VSRDHKSTDEIKALFATLAVNSTWTAVNNDDPFLRDLPAEAHFGRNSSATWQPDCEEQLPASVKLLRGGLVYHLPLPGEHNLENLRAALCVCEQFRCGPECLVEGVRNYEGVARRFAITRTMQDIIVVDDFAHNPAKIAAAVRASRGLSGRIIALYQPHGFAPTRFLKDDYIAAFRAEFRTNDMLLLLPIYYAGGTAQKNISSTDIVAGLGPVPFTAEAIADREELLAALRSAARPGDCVLVMGARDPSLPGLVKKVVDLFGGEKKSTSS
jgi:UDP-N-acetylmuramate--alanine ligase